MLSVAGRLSFFSAAALDCGMWWVKWAAGWHKRLGGLGLSPFCAAGRYGICGVQIQRGHLPVLIRVRMHVRMRLVTLNKHLIY